VIVNSKLIHPLAILVNSDRRSCAIWPMTPEISGHRSCSIRPAFLSSRSKGTFFLLPPYLCSANHFIKYGRSLFDGPSYHSKVSLLASSGSKSASPRKGTVYHPTFVECGCSVVDSNQIYWIVVQLPQWPWVPKQARGEKPLPSQRYRVPPDFCQILTNEIMWTN
jgi:hypothetical protein